jgi:hypothetical protein
VTVGWPIPFYATETLGGARRNRTDDLFNAIEALSQLSYGPAPAGRLLRRKSAQIMP